MAKIVVLEDKGDHVLPMTVTDAVRANDDSANLTELLDSLRSDIGAIAKLIGEDADGNVFVRRKDDGTARALYSFGAISTKGNSNDSSGGGGGADLSAVWQSLTTNIDSFADLKINTNHIPTLTSAKIGDFASAVAALVPTNISQLVNDAGFITASAIANKANKATTLAGYGISDAIPQVDLPKYDIPYKSMIGYGYEESGFPSAGGFMSAIHSSGNYGFMLSANLYNSKIYFKSLKDKEWYDEWTEIATKGTTLAHYGITDALQIGADITAPNINVTAHLTANSISATKISSITDTTMVANLHTQYASNLVADDNRYANEAPYEFNTFGLKWRFKTDTAIGLNGLGGVFSGVLELTPWKDRSGGPAHQLAFESNGNILHRYGVNAWQTWRKLAFTDEVVKIGADITAPNIHASTLLSANSVNLAECIVCNNSDGIINLFGDKIVANSSIEAKSTFKIGNATLYYDAATDSIVCDKNVVALGAISTKG